VLAVTVRVRRATHVDVDLVAPLFDAYRQFYALPTDLAAARQFVGDRLQRGDSVVFVATDTDGTGLGFAQLYPTLCSLSLRPYAVLFDLYVAPHTRRRGVGRQLLEHAHGYARTAGLDRLELQTARTNVEARALYESLGWTRDDIFLVYTWRSA
jgi:ribosomal protein S18 acetylase RimI-like enzyme